MREYTEVIREKFAQAVAGGNDAAAAMEGLLQNSDPDIRKLAVAAAALRESMEKQDAAPLADAMKAFDTLPQTSFWFSIMDYAATAVLGKALSMKDDSSARGAMLQNGIAMVARSVSYGFPASDKAIELVKRARESGGYAKWLSDFVLQRNEAQRPSDDGKSAFRKKGDANAAAKRRRATG
jgi:hypothetical protein